jgi:hypothetical protein
LALLLFHLVNTDAGPILSGHRGDSGWYAIIATSGYSADPKELGHRYQQSEWAFFPLYPLLVRGIMEFTGFDVVQAMEIITIPLLVLISMAFIRLARNHLSSRAADLALLLFLCFPFAIFLHVHYTEPLFLALLLWTFVALHQDRRVLAAILLASMVLVRPTAWFIFPAAFLYLIERQGHQAPGRIPLLTYIRSATIFIPAIIVFGGYCVYQYQLTGDAFAFSTAQKGWGRRWSWPWEGFFRSSDPATQIESYYTILLVVASFFLLKRMPASYKLLVLLSILMPLLSGSVDSMTRFTLVMFPLFFGAAGSFPMQKRSWPLLLMMLFLQLVAAWLWSQGHALMA